MPARIRIMWSSSLRKRGRLSRDSRPGQRIGAALAVEIDDGVMDGLVEGGGVGEGLVGEVMGLEVAPDRLDVVEFGRVFRQPFDGEPVCAGGQGGERTFAGVDRTIVLDQHDRLGLSPGLRSIEMVELLEMGDEIAAALGRAGMDDELTRDVIERPQHRDLLGLPRRRHAQVRPRLRPGAGEIGMSQRLALIAVEKNDVARFGLLFAQLQAQADPFHLAFHLTSLQRVPGPPPAELFFRKALESCERLMRTPSRASISARRRGIVQLRRSATGSSSKGVTTRNAVSLLTGAGPGATLAFSASTPPPANSLRQKRTVSSLTPNASAICGLVQPASVRSTARARSASPRSCEPASASRPARCSSVAVSGDFPAMFCTCESVPTANQSAIRWSTDRNLLRLPKSTSRAPGSADACLSSFPKSCPSAGSRSNRKSNFCGGSQSARAKSADCCGSTSSASTSTCSAERSCRHIRRR